MKNGHHKGTKDVNQVNVVAQVTKIFYEAGLVHLDEFVAHGVKDTGEQRKWEELIEFRFFVPEKAFKSILFIFKTYRILKIKRGYVNILGVCDQDANIA